MESGLVISMMVIKELRNTVSAVRDLEQTCMKVSFLIF